MSDRKVRLISAVRQNIGGRWYLAGDPLELDESDAADMVATRFATVDTTPEPTEAPKYKRRDMRAEK